MTHMGMLYPHRCLHLGLLHCDVTTPLVQQVHHHAQMSCALPVFQQHVLLFAMSPIPDLLSIHLLSISMLKLVDRVGWDAI